MTAAPSFEVAFGISGSISAYKSLDVIRGLRKLGVSIAPILSQSAANFVTPWTVETMSESPLIQADIMNGKITHLDQFKSSDVFVICPASANTIAKLAHGRCQDLLSSSFLSFTGPKIIFPSMHTEMYENPITQSNLATLMANGVTVIPADTGALACGDVGSGRLPDPALIAQLIYAHLLEPLDLNGKAITITCGGTSEPIDPVRQITNDSSGLSGHALANIAAAFGANVTLIRANKHPVLSAIKCIDVRSAQDMQRSVLQQRACDVFIMNAAVSDFTLDPHSKKQPGGQLLNLTLEPTEDILKAFNDQKKSQCKSIGFCLSDDEELIHIAQEKMNYKGCDVMVANGPENFGNYQRTLHIIKSNSTQSLTECRIETAAIEILKSVL